MDYYELMPGVYRIQAGVGTDGEIYGAIFLEDNPGILIGASGGMEFVKALDELLDHLKFNKALRIYFPAVTFNEIYTATLLKKKFPDIVFYVHIDLIEEFKHPEDNFATNRYQPSSEIENFFAKKLPREIEDVIGFDKAASFETEKTKILLIPFPGPHKGHSYIYSRDHKLLCSGLILGRTSNPQSYYIDRSGSFFQYENGLSFLEKARSEIIFPAYDEPEFTSDLKFKAESTRDAIKTDRENILDICSLKYKSLKEITKKYESLYGSINETPPYDRVDLNQTKVYMHLENLVENKVIIKQENQYRLNK